MPYDLTGQKLIELTNLLLQPEYQDKLDELQMKMAKMPVHDLDVALTHMEYLMEIGNFDHLKSNIVNQSAIEILNLDVYIVLFFIVLCMTLINLSVIYFIFYIPISNKIKTD